jgi:ubiquinone biosynthesis protein UbiJ
MDTQQKLHTFFAAPPMTEDALLQVALEQIKRLNDEISELRGRVARRLARIESLEAGNG